MKQIQNNIQQNNIQKQNIFSQQTSLKSLPRTQQLQYSAKLLELLKQMQNPNHEVDWNDIIFLRAQFNLPQHNKDSLRRSIILRELIEADCITSIDPNGITFLEKNDEGKFEEVQAPVGTFRKEFKLNAKTGDYNQVSESILPMSLEESASPKDILRLHGYDENKFELIKCRTSIWQQRNKINGVKDLYSSKIEVQPKQQINKENNVNWAEIFVNIIEEAGQKIQAEHISDSIVYANEKISNKNNNNDDVIKETLLIMLTDCHLGRCSTLDETGYRQTLESNITKLYITIDKFIDKFKDRKFKRIILPFGNDFLNSSFTGKTSSQLHEQDNSTTMIEIYKQSAIAMINIIRKLSKLAPVYVPLVQGNHDRFEEAALILMFDSYFKNNTRVAFDTSCTPRKYIENDNILICLSHGYEDKKHINGNIVLAEAKNKLYNKSSIYYFLGHAHHLEVTENAGMEIYTCPAFAENDNWTERAGFKAKSRTMGFIFNEDELIETHYVAV